MKNRLGMVFLLFVMCLSSVYADTFDVSSLSK